METGILSLAGIILASNGLWTLLLKIYENRTKEKTPMENMILAVGRDRLLYLAKYYISIGFIPEDSYEAFDEMGKAYLSMGGNSLVKKKYEEALALPVQEGDSDGQELA